MIERDTKVVLSQPYGNLQIKPALYPLPSRRLEDRIIALCKRLVVAPIDSQEFSEICPSLRACLREHIAQTRARLAKYPPEPERRKHG